MSGHSKWATIHRKKGLIDAERGKVFQKIAKEIYVAARGTNGDIDMNPSLRAVVEKARSNNMPKDNIEKAIQKAVGATDGENYEAIRYEGYASGGVAIMVDCLTDNRNRAAMLVRSTLTKRGGNLGTDGSVSYMFSRKGVIVIENKYDFDKVMDIAITNDALDITDDGDVYTILTNPSDFIKVKEALEQGGITDFITSEVTYVADNLIELDDDKKEKVLDLIEALEDIDDVQNVYHNMSV